MAQICVYDPLETDFSMNGLGVLTPIDATVTREELSQFEIEIVHPIDSSRRWTHLQYGNLVKANCPVRETPYVEDPEETQPTETVTKTREIYKVENGVALNMRAAPSNSAKIYGSLKGGSEVVKIDASGSWYHVITVDGGRDCWMNRRYLDYARTETETVTQMQTVGPAVVQPAGSREQLFRLYDREPDSAKHTVTAHGRHVFFDLLDDYIDADYAPEAEQISDVIDHITSSLMIFKTGASGNPFRWHLAAGLTAKITGDYGFKNPIEALVNDDDGILKQAGATLFVDNFDIWILPDVSRDRGVSIRRRKDLKSVKVKDGYEGVYTRIEPTGKDKDGNKVFLTDEPGTGRYVDSPHIGDYSHPRPVLREYDLKQVAKDADNETTFPATAAGKAAMREKMRAMAEEEYTKDGIDLPAYSMQVDLLALQKTDEPEFREYPNYEALNTAFWGDLVHVEDDVLMLDAAARVTGYKWDPAREKYKGMSIGAIEEVNQIYNSNIKTGSITGSKIAPNSASGSILRNLSVQYGKFDAAAIGQLSADALTAHIAHINELTAGTVEADTLTAALAHLYQLIADKISAGDIETGTITAALANLNNATIQRATINYAKIVSADVDQLITHDAIGDKYYIAKLMVTNLQVVEQTVGSLIVKASNGSYYRLDIDAAAGTVVPTSVTVTAGEIDAGVTSDGRRSIIETDLTVADLSASSVKAINALIDKITASRIEVDTLVARDAFIQALRTTKIIGDKTITMIAADASDAKTAASGAQSTANTAQTTATAAQSTATAAQATANAAQQTANAKTTQFYQPVEPAAALTGDIWTNTNADRVLRKDGSETAATSTQEAYSIPVPGNVYSVQPTIIGGKSVVQSGELISADIEAVKSIGFNLLNPDEFEPNTRIYVSSGSALSYSGLTASGWIEAFPSTDYYFKMHSIGSSYAGTAFYDADKRYISGVAHTRSSSYTVGILTTPPNCAYIRTCWTNSDTDLCVNVSDADFNGQFTEFTPVQSFPIPAEVRAQYPLRSVGTVHDSYEYDAIDGTWSYVQRVGSIDLGTPQWTTTGVSIVRFITADGTAVNSDWSDGNNTLCSRYAPHYNSGGYTDPADKFVFIDGNGRIVVSDSEFSDGASLKAALNGVMLYFELAAPVTVDITDLMPVCNIVNAQQGGQIVFAQAKTALAVPSTLMLSPWRDITEEADALALAAQDDAAVAQSSADEARRIAELAAAGVDETQQVIRIETDGLYLYPGKRTESGGIEINTDGYHQRFTNRSQRVQRSGTARPDLATSNRVIILGTQAMVRTVDGGTGFRLATADDYAALGE